MLPHPRYNITRSSWYMIGIQITAVHAFVLNMLKRFIMMDNPIYVDTI